jgi:DNA-binding response OmpR family regulator
MLSQYRQSGESSRVLVVDDDDGIRSVLGDALREEGYDVRDARDGDEALAVISRWPPDVIALDLRLPRVRGEVFTREARRRRLAPAAATLVISAEPAAPMIASQLGASFMRKPFDLDDFLMAVDELAAPPWAAPRVSKLQEPARPDRVS